MVARIKQIKMLFCLQLKNSIIHKNVDALHIIIFDNVITIVNFNFLERKTLLHENEIITNKYDLFYEIKIINVFIYKTTIIVKLNLKI